MIFHLEFFDKDEPAETGHIKRGYKQIQCPYQIPFWNKRMVCRENCNVKKTDKIKGFARQSEQMSISPT
jgi:hypothetical protein